MPSPIDKLRKPQKPPSPMPDNQLLGDAAEIFGDAEDLPEGAFPLPSDCGPMPLPGRDSVEEPTDGEA